MSIKKIIWTLFSGNAFAQLLMIAFAPIIARLYTAAEFGIYAAYVTVITITVKVASLGLEKAIPLERNRVQAKKLMHINQYLAILISLLILAVYLVFGVSILNWVGIYPTIWEAILLSAGIAMTSMIQIYNYENMNREQYRTLAMTRALQNGFTGITQIGFALAGVMKTTGLLLGDVLGKAISVLILTKVSKKDKIKQRVTWRDTKELLTRYKGFIIFSMPAGLINTLSLQLPLLLVLAIFGANDSGQYAFVQRVIIVPISVLAITLSQFFYSVAAKDINNNKRKVYALYMSLTKKLTVYLTLPFGIFVFFSPSIFRVLFGEEWLLAGQLTQVLGGMFLTQIIFSATSQILYLMERQKLQIILEIIKLGVVILIFETMQGDFLQTMFVYGGVIAVFNLGLWWIGRQLLRRN
ncbi:oligosaccharide flippase family protein [Listeria newyorkensis]|uniref:Oligosaccharide flippase family protein n=1 Tax=Listeria newyorkensis TaxID=1497681 RepID=A0A841YT67_9LIST|nr:oligosaccharide flippase family protein [Listeria newyorkensis]MBC1456931.1 oligosaccharide flippase family protein [Listeria newyorkensis]